MNDQRLAHRRIFPKPSTILLLLAMMWWSGHLPTATASSDPNRVGEYIVRLNLTCNGTAASAISSDGISGSSKESFSGSVNSEIHYEVVQTNPETFESGDQISGYSTASVSGGGSSSAKSKDGSVSASWTFLPDPDFDPTIAYACGTFESGSDPDVTPNAWACRGENPNYRFKISPDTSTPSLEAPGAAADAVAKLDDFDFTIPTNKVGWTRSGMHSAQVNYPTIGGSIQGSASVSVTVEFIPDQNSPWEAIIEETPDVKPAYEDWIPLGGKDDTDENPGNSLPVHVYLRAKDGSGKIPPLAKYSFFLKDVSREPGISMNFPHRSVPAYLDDAERPFDLRIQPGDRMTPSEVGQLTETDEMVAEAGVGINSYDYGSYGKLRVVAQTSDGFTLVAHPKDQPDVDFLSIPKDDNLNHVADAWEKQTNVFGLNLKEDSNRAISPAYAGQSADGDGISFYEKYRGFNDSFDGTHYAYERLDPHFKYLFIRNPDGLVASTFNSADGVPESYMIASSCQVRYVNESGWTGWGSFENHKRIVNFNSTQETHAIDQHAVYVVLDPSPNPADPARWLAFLASIGSGADPFLPGTEGCTYPDPTGPAAFEKHMRPSYTYEVVIFGYNVGAYVSDCVRYHSAADLAGKTDVQASNFILDYMQDHFEDAGQRRTIEMSSTIAHELGHATGIIHHEPNTWSSKNPDLINCTMRYYGPKEFPVNPADRFELTARGNQPSEFCRKVFNCWSQLAINDDPAAPASPGIAPASEVSTAWFFQHQPATRQSSANSPALSISADLAWPDLVEGDAMRIWGRLHGSTTGMASNWVDGFQFTLKSITTNGQRQIILAPAGFKPFVQPLLFDAASLGLANPTLIREWLVTPAAAQLAPGNYALEIAWNGTGFTAATNLPADGLIKGSEIQFEVQPADNNPALGSRERHLAWLANAQGDNAGVIEHGQQAALLDPNSIDPLALQTVFLMSTAALNQNDPMTAARTLNTLSTLLPGSTSHLAELARSRFELLAPSVKANRPGSGSTKTQLEINGLPGHQYLLERSLNLKTWTSVSTNTLLDFTALVEDTKATPGTNRFYRVKWIK
jgi:hypothetical protein